MHAAVSVVKVDVAEDERPVFGSVDTRNGGSRGRGFVVSMNKKEVRGKTCFDVEAVYTSLGPASTQQWLKCKLDCKT